MGQQERRHGKENQKDRSVSPKVNGNKHSSSSAKFSSAKTKDMTSLFLSPKFIAILTLAIIPATGIIAYHLYQKYVYLPGLVNTASDLPRVLPANNFNVSKNADQYWGSYGANLYFGLRTRSPDSPMMGLMWFEQPRKDSPPTPPKFRFWCDQSDGLRKYGWTQHDGRNFGIQMIEENLFSIETSFVKRPGGKNGGDWTARITVAPNEGVDVPYLVSFVVIFANPKGSLKPRLKGDQPLQYVERIDGDAPDLGAFSVTFNQPANTVARSFFATAQTPLNLANLKELMINGMGVLALSGNSNLPQYLGLMGYVPVGQHIESPNVVAMQFTVLKSSVIEIIYTSQTSQSGNAEPKRPQLTGDLYAEELAKKRAEYERRFEAIFGLGEKQYAPAYIEMGRVALSNMLGSISYFHGYSRVISKHNRKPVPYGPLTLYTGVPSRSFFPRGFLWDEGFHNLLIMKWDPELTFEILGAWLDLMNIEGWIPRELILGSEAEAKVPAEFIVQNNAYANPPMFFYTLHKLLENKEAAERHREFFAKIYPRLAVWYAWLNTSQSGPTPGSYRWRGRNATTELELNPKTLTSGFDDYPRASHPTNDEHHLDLYCWMAFCSRFMSQLADFLKQPANPYKSTAEYLHREDLLDRLHWSEKSQKYADFGLHTRNVKLERPKVQTKDGRILQGPDMKRVVLREPKLRLVTDTFGYVSLFPLLLRVLRPDSPHLKQILTDLTNEDLLWTPYGLRSLAKNAPLYMVRNTEHDPPYWRGAVWLNVNFLCLDALHYYAETPGPHRDFAFEVYGKLRSGLVSNVLRQFRQTGYLWEHYNDATGAGEGTHPFTGWTSLVLLMMSENY